MNFTLTRPNLIKLLVVPLFVFLATLAAVNALDRPTEISRPASAGAGFAGDARSTDARIASLQKALEANRDDVNAYSGLGFAYLQKARETADAGFYNRSEMAFSEARERKAGDAGGLTGLGVLANARHDFRAALRYGRQALAASPGAVKTYGVLVDAQVELGRYEAARSSLQRMVDLKPNLSSYARVSYFRELHGDLAGALTAMRLAASAGGDAPENLAYVQTLAGNIEFARGRNDRASRAYRLALSRYAGYAPAQAGLARVAAARGDLDRSIRLYRSVVTRLPLPEYSIALGEAELAAGRPRAAKRDFELVQVQQRLQRRGGVNVDAQISVFESDHGDRRRGLRLARRAWGAAPSVRSADALGWALTRAGRPESGLRWGQRALKLGWRDPLVLYHAGVSAARAGEPGAARRYLRRALTDNPEFSPYFAPRARRTLKELS